MNKKIGFLLVLIMCIFLVPFRASAQEREYLGQKFNYLNLKEALAEEEIDLSYSDYYETDDQAVIYMFRGNGCGYCKAFLNFLNSISEEYGKYFKLRSFEVWYDESNGTLMNGVASYLNKDVGGVPFIIIGDQVFEGYSSSYDSDIKKAIKDLYNTDASARYDVLNKMEEENFDLSSVVVPSGDDGTDVVTTSDDTYSNNVNVSNDIIWNFVFTALSTVIIIVYVNYKFKNLPLNEPKKRK